MMAYNNFVPEYNDFKNNIGEFLTVSQSFCKNSVWVISFAIVNVPSISSSTIIGVINKIKY